MSWKEETLFISGNLGGEEMLGRCGEEDARVCVGGCGGEFINVCVCGGGVNALMSVCVCMSVHKWVYMCAYS